jgi:hypothetical protein
MKNILWKDLKKEVFGDAKFLNDFHSQNEIANYIISDFRPKMKTKRPDYAVDYFLHVYPEVRALSVILRSVVGKEELGGSVLIVENDLTMFEFNKIDLSNIFSIDRFPRDAYDLYLYSSLDEVLELIITHLWE